MATYLDCGCYIDDSFKRWFCPTCSAEPSAGVSETAIVHVKPDADGAVALLRQEAAKLLEYANERLIASQDDVKAATDDLTVVSRLKKAIEDRRKEYVQPLNEHLAVINAAFKLVSSPVIEADNVTRKKILGWQNEQERICKEAEELARMQAEVDARKAILEGKTPTGELVPIIDTPEAIAKTTYTDTGSLSRAKIRKWKIVDLNQVPRDYLMLDTAKIGKMVKAGIPEIPGIEIWEESTLQVRPK